MALGERQDVLDVAYAIGGQCCGGANEVLELCSGREDDVGKRLGVGLVADGVRAPAPDVNHPAGVGDDPTHLAEVVFEVDGELAALEAVDLVGIVTMQEWWPAARRQPDVDGNSFAPPTAAARSSPSRGS